MKFFWKKESDYEAKFFLEIEILNWKFFNKSDFELKTYRPGRYWKQRFSNNRISEKNYFRKNQVLNAIFEKQDFDGKITSKKIVLTQFAQQTTTNFSFFVLIWKGSILNRAFPLKVRFWNWIFWKKNQILKQIFSYKTRVWMEIFTTCQTLNWNYFVLSGFEKLFASKSHTLVHVLRENDLFCISRAFWKSMILYWKSQYVLNWKKIKRVRLPNKFFRLVRFWKKNYKVSDFKLK